MKQKTHRLLSLLLCLVMVLGMLPMTAFAAEITNGNARVTAPVAGGTPSFTATSDDPSKYSVEVLRWRDVAHSQDITQVKLNDSSSPYYNYKFISGMVYEVVVEFTAVGENTLSHDNSFTINGNATGYSENGLKRTYKFTAGSSATVPTIANQEVPVGKGVYIPWPEGAKLYQLYEVGNEALKYSTTPTGSPKGMYIPAQSTATTKAYTVKVNFSDGWIDSNEFTVTWTNSAHTVTVTGGTANPSSATVGTEITLTPSAAPSGLVFDKWEVVSGGVTVTDNKFTMPDTNVEIKATYKVSIENQEVPVETDVFIPWPEGATRYQLFEGSTSDWSGDKSGFPTGMYIPAQSTAVTKTYKFKVFITGIGWLESNEFTVTWTNAAHTVTVTGGTASPSSATVGTEITLTPSAAPSGLVFDKWEVVSGGVTVMDNKFTMPDTNVEIKATYKVSIANQEVPVGTEVFIPWPEGATSYQRFEGSTFDESGDKSGYPTGMYIPAQSTATTKTYKFRVQFSDGWIDSNEFTVTWKSVTTYSATVADINISLPAGYGSSAIDALGEQRAIKITNTGTETLNIGTPTLSGTNADAFNIQSFGSSSVTAGSTNSSAYAVRPETGLEPGTYTATISCTDADGKLAVPVTATVTLTVGEHHFDTSTWENNATHHWNPCTDTGCTAHGNEALHNSDTVKNAEAATFDTDGYTGDKHCSVCDRKMETGTAIAAGKYIRESKATMTPASITADQCANDLVFASLETSKYTVALHSVYDMTDTSLNTASDKYPTATKFVAGHQYRIVFEFTAVSPYAYDETRSTHCSTFTLNGAATNLAPFTYLAGSPNRMIELTAGASGITTYTVSFNANGGTGTMTDVTGVSGSYTLPGNGFTAPANKQFKGWATSASGTVISGNTINVTANTILYAIWEDIPVTEYNITVTDGKATVGGVVATKAEAGATVTLTANAAPSGKVFDQWVVESGSITLADANSATTTFTMPAEVVSVKATYKAASHTHTYDQEIVKTEALKTAADCTHDAVYYKSCSCGAISTTETFTAIGSALGHDYTKKVENNTYLKTAASNCTEYNVYWYACSRCDANAKDDAEATDKYYTSTTAGNHSFTEKIEDAAHYVAGTGTDCQSVKKYYFDCAYCDLIGTATWDSTTYGPHNYAATWSSDADGHWHECSLCHGKKDEAAHTPGAAATETTPQKCTECDYIITAALGHTHSLTKVEAKAPTCTEDGNIEYYTCSGCSKLFADATGNVEITADKTVDKATGHTYEWVIDKEATATEKGSKHEECKVCHDKKAAVEIPATGSGSGTITIIVPSTEETKPADQENPTTGAAVNPGTGAPAAGSSFGYPFVALAAVDAIYVGAKKLAKKDEE